MVKILTFSHLSARSQLRKWQWPSSSRCVAGHRQGHPEKTHISLKNSPTAAESWIIPYLQVWGFLPVNLHFATKLFTAVPNFLGHWMWVPAPTSKPKIKHMRLLTLQLGHVIERYVEIERWAQMVKIRHFLTFPPVRSSENDNDHPHLVV